MNKQKLFNKNILISAAAEGIGWIIAEECMNQGAILYISDNNQDTLNKLKKHKLFEKQFYLSNVNACNPKQVEQYFSTIKNKVDCIDALINNVGIAGPTGHLEDLNTDDWKKTIDVNINSHFYFSKLSIPLLKKNKGGSIINLSSTAGLFGFPLRTPYAASKWAVIGLTKSLAMELGEHNIRVNAICPGSVIGDRMKRVIKAQSKSIGISEEKLQSDYESMTSLKTFVYQKDIASIAIFLLSEEAQRISGQVMTVDGNTERMN